MYVDSRTTGTDEHRAGVSRYIVDEQVNISVGGRSSEFNLPFFIDAVRVTVQLECISMEHSHLLACSET